VIQGRSVLAVIPARGGSKGLPRKNVLAAAGKPVIAWSIEAGRTSRYIDKVVLSSDDDEILAVAEKWGCEFCVRRPTALASDTAKIEDVLIHVLDNEAEQYDLIVLLQPTSPLRSAADIDRCIEICTHADTHACVSVCEPSKSPYWMFTIDDGGRMQPLFATEFQTVHRRQDLPPAYVLNGAIYVAETAWFREQRGFLGPKTRTYPMPSKASVDLDSELDFKLLNILLEDVGR